MSQAPEIIENFRDFESPRGFKDMVKELLRYIPGEYLSGLQSIVLTNQAALNRDRKQQKTWSRNRKIRLADALGYYTPATPSSRACVVLHVDNMAECWDGWFARLPLIRYAPIAEVLYHEIGHHIHAAHRPIYQGKEDVANYWGRKLWSRFIRKRYWYAMPILYPMAKILRIIKGKRTQK